MLESSSQRATQLWQRLAGMFGADSLERKFGISPPGEWIAAIGTLNDAQLANGLNGLVRDGSSHLPTLPEFIKQCRTSPSFSAPQTRLLQRGDDFDKWSMAANDHLLAYIQRNPKHYHPDASFGDDGHGSKRIHPGPEGTRRTRLLVDGKNGWAQCMRETQEDDRVDVETQKGMWELFMGAAEEKIDKHAAA